MSRELKPCPFCGGRGVFSYIDDTADPNHGGHFVHCENTGCSCSVGLIYTAGDDPKPLLAERWNTRALSEGGGEAVAWRIEQLILPQTTLTEDAEFARLSAESRYQGQPTARVTPLYAHPVPGDGQ